MYTCCLYGAARNGFEACKIITWAQKSRVAASRMQIVPAWPPVAGKLPSISFMLHATGGHSGTICIRLAATRVQFESDWRQAHAIFACARIIIWIKKWGNCRGPNVVIDDGQVDAPNSQLISCLNSSLGRAFACSAGGRRFAPRPWHVCLDAYLEDRDDPGQVSHSGDPDVIRNTRTC